MSGVLRTLLLPQTLPLPQSGLRHSLDQLCVVMEAAVQPEPAAEEASCEESPLLSNGVNFKKEPVMCNQLLRLIPEGPPEVRRNIPPRWAERLPGHLASKPRPRGHLLLPW